MAVVNDALNRLEDLVRKAKAAGADDADAMFAEGRSLAVTCRLGRREQVEGAEESEAGLRVFVGKRQAVVSSSDLSGDAMAELVERAVAMARAVPEDPYCGLADPGQIAADVPEIDSYDSGEPSADDLLAQAMAAEAAGLAVPGITNSEGGEAGWSSSHAAIVASNGLAKQRSRSNFSVSVSVLAGQGQEMERDYDFASAVYAEDLPNPAEIGRSAGERATRRLHPRKAKTAQVPVIYEPRVARSLIGHLAGAINGTAVARGTTFLRDSMGDAILAETLTVIDDPLRRRGLKSRPFDSEGITTAKRTVVEHGILKSWILDLRSARQLGLQTTGHAVRGLSSPPSPSTTNFYLEPGSVTREALISGVKSGFLVCELIGFGVNTVTGDYSRGAGGFWIENGEIAYPVSEVTVAGNLLEMFRSMSAADDLEFRYGTDAPTIRIDGMTVAGI